jgi:hypothetical protein
MLVMNMKGKNWPNASLHLHSQADDFLERISVDIANLEIDSLKGCMPA